MKEIKMNGYDTFRCIADRCSISCCEEWKISVDEESYQNWMTTDPPFVNMWLETGKTGQ